MEYITAAEPATSRNINVNTPIVMRQSPTTIGAGHMPNRLASLEGWIANPWALKPSLQMPPNTQFSGLELCAVASYVSSLK